MQWETITTALAAALPFPAVAEREPVQPPCAIVRPQSPWATPLTLLGTGGERYEITAVGLPVDTKAVGYHLASMLEAIGAALASLPVTFIEAAAPIELAIGGVTYLAAPITITAP